MKLELDARIKKHDQARTEGLNGMVNSKSR
jgi:hypothetical protein